MDISTEFEIPLGPSQTIDSDSDNSNSGQDKDESGGRSPIIRRSRPYKSRPPGSPLILSKRRGRTPDSSRPAKTRSVRRALEVDFQDNEVSSSGPAGDENENIVQGSLEKGLTTLNNSEHSSQQVSSCDSSIGKDPQPILSSKIDSFLSASTIMANLDEEEEENQEPDTTVNLLDSGRKRKHVKFGFAEQMEKLIQRKKSHETLEKYQNKQEGNEKKNWEEFQIVRVENVGNTHLLYGEREVLAINSLFCPRTPSAGDRVRFSSSKTWLLEGERPIRFGVTSLSLEQGKPPGPSETELTRSMSLCCSCLDGFPTCLKASTDFQLEVFKYGLESAENSQDSDQSSDVTQSPEEEEMSVARAVEKLGGFSSSPVSHLRTMKLRLEVLVHRVFFKAKQNEADSEMGELDFQVSLLCEDLKGDFCLVKLSAGMEEDPHWRVLFRDNWEFFQGCRVRLMSPLNVEERNTRSHHNQLFDVIRSIRETNQRICYVFTLFPGSQFRMEESAVVSLKSQLGDASQSTVLLSEGQRRLNWKVTVIYFNPEDRILHVLRDQLPGVVRLEVRSSLFISKLLFNSGRFFFSCSVLGLCLDSSGHLALDCLSSIVDKCPVTVDISRLSLFSLRSSSAPGDLCVVEGPVVSVDQEASLQWVECDNCQSEDIHQAGDGWRCSSCGDRATPSLKIELVCDVGQTGATVRLTDSAMTVLPEGVISDVGGFHPADVIGQMVPSTLCVVGTDSLAREC